MPATWVLALGTRSWFTQNGHHHHSTVYPLPPDYPAFIRARSALVALSVRLRMWIAAPRSRQADLDQSDHLPASATTAHARGHRSALASQQVRRTLATRPHVVRRAQGLPQRRPGSGYGDQAIRESPHRRSRSHVLRRPQDTPQRAAGGEAPPLAPPRSGHTAGSSWGGAPAGRSPTAVRCG